MKQPTWTTVAFAGSGGFLAGAIAVAVLLQLPPRQTGLAEPRVSSANISPKRTGAEEGSGQPPTRIAIEPTADLKQKHLLLPVQGAQLSGLTDSFDESRTGGRHEAIDILAPRNTPVLAVEDGTIARLFQSRAGGTTIYQFDPASAYIYYYAHLERYAEGLHEKQYVRRGDVIGYVGTSGNAPKNTPHLHFAIFRAGPEKKWWEGTPVDPFNLLNPG
jgi:murein DD-endopeptidase MepM/ murein hydrolase activator NlpD